MEFHLSYFKSCCIQYVNKFGKLNTGHRIILISITRSVFISIPVKGNAKQCSNYWTFAFILHSSNVMLKILQARLQQYVNQELSDVQAGFRKGRGTRDQIANIHWIIEKAREFQKNVYFCFTDYVFTQPLTVWITTNCGKYLKRWEYQTTSPVSWEIYMWVKK